MRRSFSMNHGVNLAVNHKLFPMATGVAVFLASVLAMGLMLPTSLEAQGPALTTISEVSYRGQGTRRHE